MSPLDYLKIFWDGGYFDLLLFQSNVYAVQQGRGGGSLKINKNEMEQFVSILLQMGIANMPVIEYILAE